MHISDHPDNASGVCILTGSSNDPEGFLNLEMPTDARRLGNPAVVSITFLRQAAAEVGMTPPTERADLLEQIKELQIKLTLAEAERDALTAEVDALVVLTGPKVWGKAQHVRKNAGFKGRRTIDSIQKFMKDEITEEELEAVLCSMDS